MKNSVREEGADVAVVLGARVGPGGEPSAALIRRAEHGARLYLQGAARRLLLTGGVVGHPPAEAEAMRRIAIALGVAPSDVEIEDQAKNTLENAAFSAAICRARGWTEVLVVTDRFHMARALMSFRAFGIAARGSAPPIRGLSWSWPYMALRDVIALPIYRRRLKRYLDAG